MKTLRIVSLIAAAAGALLLNSCGCCTGVTPDPELRPLPDFRPVDPGK